MFIRVPRLCLYFPLILFGSLVAVAYFARPRVSLLGRPRFRFCVFVYFFGFSFFAWLSPAGPKCRFLYFFVGFCIWY